MPAALPENFLFIPELGTASSGTLYELDSGSSYCTNSFAVIPYSNPGVKKPEARFYEIKNRIPGTDLSAFVQPAMRERFKLRSGCSRSQYLDHVHRLKQHIQRGDIYEINYCIQLSAEQASIDPVSVFLRLNQLAKAPYTALVKLGDEFIISASPELFLKKEGGLISTKPIKGTIRRGQNPEEDEALKNALYQNIKERTENVMAVDVARNDLSRFAKKGSVKVNKLYNIETFATVHQMVSTVSCEMKEATSFEQMLDATFPMASMTGAPKIRAMELIDAHENFKRHYYSGAMGLVDANGDFTLAVVIRSIFYNQRSRQVSLSVGSAITWLSEPEQEYEECLLKANALIKALEAELEDLP
jgi:para-aminobenzoate synthetase component I